MRQYKPRQSKLVFCTFLLMETAMAGPRYDPVHLAQLSEQKELTGVTHPDLEQPCNEGDYERMEAFWTRYDQKLQDKVNDFLFSEEGMYGTADGIDIMDYADQMLERPNPFYLPPKQVQEFIPAPQPDDEIPSRRPAHPRVPMYALGEGREPGLKAIRDRFKRGDRRRTNQLLREAELV